MNEHPHHGSEDPNVPTIISVRSGKWSDPNIWSTRKIPSHHDTVLIDKSHNIYFNIDAHIQGLTISDTASLTFDVFKTRTLYPHKNLIVYGDLNSKPKSLAVVHTIQFMGIDESKFVGGGMDIIDSDIGIWVRGNGKLNLIGSFRTHYVNLTGEVFKGDNIIILQTIPVGWRVGDKIVIAPNLSIDKPDFYKAYDVKTIKSIYKATIVLDSPLLYDHPVVIDPKTNTKYPTEVMNLTRNIKIKGEKTGRGHINIGMITSQFDMSNVEIEYMGVPNILGRYPLHHHHCGDGSRGSVFNNIVIHNSGNRGYVPHASHGICYMRCIAHDILKCPFWWDGPPSNDSSNPINNSNTIRWGWCISSLTKVDPPFRGFREPSFQLGSGKENRIHNCIAIGNQGNADAAGYVWPEASNNTDNVWEYVDNLSKSHKRNGITVWQNDKHKHIINGYIAYNNGFNGIDHGAYGNAYEYRNCILFNNGNGLLIHSLPTFKGEISSNGYVVEFINVRSTEPLIITRHTTPGNGPTLFKDCDFPKIIIAETPTRGVVETPSLLDFVDSNITPEKFEIIGMEEKSIFRIQNGDEAFRIDKRGITPILPFFKK